MSYSDTQIADILTKERLTRGEHRYLQDRNDLRLQREHHFTAKSVQENSDPDDDELMVEGGEDDDQMVTPQEYANSLNKEEIKSLLKERGVSHSANATKEELVPILVKEIEKANT